MAGRPEALKRGGSLLPPETAMPDYSVTSYCGSLPIPAEWLLRWNLDPVLLLGLALCAVMALRSQHLRMALGGVGALALAFVSPICALSVALFSVWALHHLLLVTVAAPLIALAFPARRAGASWRSVNSRHGNALAVACV